MQKEIIKALIKKEKKDLKKLKNKTELTEKDKAKIMRKFNRLVEQDMEIQDMEYEQVWQNVFDSIDSNFKSYFPDLVEFEEEALELIQNNK